MSGWPMGVCRTCGRSPVLHEPGTDVICGYCLSKQPIPEQWKPIAERKTDWHMVAESSTARASYYQRLADFHRASAEEARRNISAEKEQGTNA